VQIGRASTPPCTARWTGMLFCYLQRCPEDYGIISRAPESERGSETQAAATRGAR
jgi:hypothetical protein